MASKHLENFIPYLALGKEVKVRTIEELKNIVLNSDDVRDVIVKVVKERTEQYRHHY